jgi:hypothetical protein
VSVQIQHRQLAQITQAGDTAGQPAFAAQRARSLYELKRHDRHDEGYGGKAQNSLSQHSTAKKSET